MTRPRPAIVILALSLIGLGVGITAVATAGPESSVQSVGQRPSLSEPPQAAASPSEAKATPSSSTPSPRETTNEATPTADPATQEPTTQEPAGTPQPRESAGTPTPPSPPNPPTRVNATGLPQRNPANAPKTIRIDAIGVTAPIDEVGLTTTSQVEVPEDVRRVGWYALSQVTQASRGATVLVGHRDGIGQGAGSFYDLGELNVGDKIVLTTHGGETLTYAVASREGFNKKSVPLAELFSSGGPHRLTLITCGGPFDEETLGYTDNVVVVALPV